jgi:hypothetical protein
MPSHASLGDVVSTDGNLHVEIHHRFCARIGKILRGRPHDRATRSGFQRFNRSAKTRATKQKTVPRRQSLANRQVKPKRIMRWL